MRVGNTEKAKKHINKITHPQLMPKKQHTYILYLQAVMNTQEFGLAKANNFEKPSVLGLEQNKTKQLQEKGASTAEKRCANLLVNKKLDQNGVMKEQITTMQKQRAAQKSNENGSNDGW